MSYKKQQFKHSKNRYLEKLFLHLTPASFHPTYLQNSKAISPLKQKLLKIFILVILLKKWFPNNCNKVVFISLLLISG